MLPCSPKISLKLNVWEETIQKLVDAMEVFRFPGGTQVTRQGSARGTHFFIVSKGTMVILRRLGAEIPSHITMIKEVIID